MVINGFFCFSYEKVDWYSGFWLVVVLVMWISLVYFVYGWNLFVFNLDKLINEY